MNQLYTDRLARVCSRLREHGLTQMIVSDPLSIGYLTGVWIEPYERLFAFYIRIDGKHIFFLNNLFVRYGRLYRHRGFPCGCRIRYGD